jgi:hypothetical protein
MAYSSLTHRRNRRGTKATVVEAAETEESLLGVGLVRALTLNLLPPGLEVLLMPSGARWESQAARDLMVSRMDGMC